MSLLLNVRYSTEPLYLRLAAAIEQAIAEGRVMADENFPSVRQLSDSLGVSRATVLKSIAYLRERGVLETRQGAGTRLTAEASPDLNEVFREETIKLDSKTLSGMGRKILSVGDVEPWRETFKPLLKSARCQSSHYLATRVWQDPLGYLPLRQHLSILAGKALLVRSKPDQLMIFSSRSVMLHLICRLFLDEQDSAVLIGDDDPLLKRILSLYCRTVLSEIPASGTTVRLLCRTCDAINNGVRLPVLDGTFFVFDTFPDLQQRYFSAQAEPVDDNWRIVSSHVQSANNCHFAIVPLTVLDYAVLAKTQIDRHWNVSEQLALYTLLVKKEKR
ncbi:MAG: GntR family transcriptional regulator [Cyanobacteria bacterium]|nr:GntR family transcriptional regulator [Cyanobacteriota bacterium]